eukprot:3941687-Rhodomonas_salina.8
MMVCLADRDAAHRANHGSHLTSSIQVPLSRMTGWSQIVQACESAPMKRSQPRLRCSVDVLLHNTVQSQISSWFKRRASCGE